MNDAQSSAVKGDGVCPVQTFCGQGKRKGSSDAYVHIFWCKDLRIFLKLRCVSTDKEEGVNFSRFCADVFYGGSLFL